MWYSYCSRSWSDTEAKSRFMSAHLAIQLFIPFCDYNSLLETFQLLKPWGLKSWSFTSPKHLLVLQRTCKLAAVESQGTCILRGRAWQQRPSRSWRGHCSHETASQPETRKNQNVSKICLYHMYITVDISLKEFINLNVFAADFFKNL